MQERGVLVQWMGMTGKKFLEGYLPYLLQTADHRLSAQFHGSLQQAGVQVSEWRVLAVLADYEPLPVQEVADIALLPQATASHACRRLEDQGLLSRSEHDDDRRRKILELTKDGRALVDGLVVEAQRFEVELLASLSVDSAALAKQLRSLIAELSPPSTWG